MRRPQHRPPRSLPPRRRSLPPPRRCRRQCRQLLPPVTGQVSRCCSSCTTCRAARRAAWRRRCSVSTSRSYRTRGSACLGASTTSREGCSGSRSALLPRIRACLSIRLSNWAAPACRARYLTSIATRLARRVSPPTRTRCSRTIATTSRTSVRSSCWASGSRSRYSTCRGLCSRLRWGRCCALSSRRWAAPSTLRSATATPPQPSRRHSRARCPSRPTPRVCWRR
mmetsp:Transcript_2963/g.9235  ORF Transcript_2963/g.9235 Transcript_2963/m.9235 type:complete len:225 (-) Transcript_2963:656-1330(-)